MTSVFLTGCMGKVKYPAYYRLNLAPPVDPPAKTNAPPSIAVREFRAPAYLREGPIVYLPSPEEIGFYEYHRWAVDPRQTITGAIVEYLRATGNFKLVKIYDGRDDVDYVLSGRLEKLNEVDYEGGAQVEVALSAQVTDPHSGNTVWANSAAEKGKVEGGNVSSVVAQMSKMTDRSIEELLKSLTLPTLSTAKR
jgi:cholesterol transport system auxiliary component